MTTKAEKKDALMKLTKDALMKLTKDALTDRILEMEAAEGKDKDALATHIAELETALKEPNLTERDVQIKSPAGPVHHFHGFVDDGEGPIVITGLPEDEIGHWAPFYTLTINGQNLGKSEIEHGD